MSKKMDEYFKKKPPSLPNSNSSTIESSHSLVTIESVPNPSTSSMEPEPVDVPTPLSDLNSRAPCQPRLSAFPKTKQQRLFDPSCDWLEYTVTLNACFCFPCRVFGVNLSTNAFTETGYRDRKHSLDKRERVLKACGVISTCSKHFFLERKRVEGSIRENAL